jgi:hypothetical protein
MTIAVSRLTRSGEFWAVSALLGGAAVAVFLGAFAIFHTPSAPTLTLGFDSVRAMMIWLGAAAGGLALVQLATAVAMFTRGGRVVAVVHRASGTLAVLLSLPVAYVCLWSLGFADQNMRVLVHSLAGCLVYGALVTKLLGLHVPRMPAWLVPVAGSLLLTTVVASSLTTSLWYFTEFGAP